MPVRLYNGYIIGRHDCAYCNEIWEGGLMSLAEVLLVIGTFGICTGVWTTLVVIIKQNAKANTDDKD